MSFATTLATNNVKGDLLRAVKSRDFSPFKSWFGTEWSCPECFQRIVNVIALVRRPITNQYFVSFLRWSYQVVGSRLSQKFIVDSILK